MGEAVPDRELRGAGEPDRGELPQVEELMRALSTAVRNYRLYGGSGAALDRFVENLRHRLAAVWEIAPSLRLEVAEDALLWDGERVYPVGDTAAELAFLFYKDGIREITLLPGLEGEIGALLAVLGRAPQLRAEEDDLITLLWEANLTSFRYEYVELSPEGTELEAGVGAPPAPIDAAAVRTAAAAPIAPQGIRPDDFQETLYFLDDSELRRLRQEIQRESDRDLWGGVLAALFDRLEDGAPERQARIVRLLAEILPTMLGGGELERAAEVLRELRQLTSQPGLLDPAARAEIESVSGQLAQPETIVELLKALEGNPQALRDEAVADLLGFFPPAALAPLTRALEGVGRPDVRRALEAAVDRLANANREALLALLADPDPGVVAGAARRVGQIGVGAAAPTLARLLDHPEPAVRLAAIEALAQLRAAVAGTALAARIEDPEREVRIAAVRALAALGYGGARAALEEALGSRRLRAADRAEKVAFYEAYGRLAGAEAVPLLARTLSGRKLLGRGESPELRACAALGLAQVRHPSAQAALLAAANDPEAVVRSAVQRALRQEAR
ncbi:MAG TPA: HEAT repeat domain-containing protein [Longimicrobiaceae bacterium]|nr:HEAT repeat domain-containing protein [Longimicrobiaceae bacterium]